MIWTDVIEMHEFERFGWLYPEEIRLVYRIDSDRRTAMLTRRVELARLEAEAWRLRSASATLIAGLELVRHGLQPIPAHATDEAERVVKSDHERGRISQQAAEMKVCVWAEDCDGGWETLCGGQFELTSGTPQSNGMAYCCYCGGSLEQIEYTDEAERAADAATPTEEA